MATPHIACEKGAFADVVLMPGDPVRAERIAKTYLDHPVLVTDVRGIKGFTGTYQGKRVSVMASGMGQPSIGIYAYELFAFYGVEKIIRVGTCGGYAPDLHVGDVVLAQGACTDGNFVAQYRLGGTFAPIADYALLSSAVAACKQNQIPFAVGNVLSSDVFYSANKDGWKAWQNMGVLAVEMETAALYMTAANLGKKALSVCTVSDSFVRSDHDLTSDERATVFARAAETALSAVLL